LHDLAALAIAALRHVVGPPGLLHRVITVPAQPLDRDDALALDRGDRHDASVG